ncbi:MAG: transketolase family protein [Clostridia bacterium]|nr:transketolase family protein [Clostridia bacterium]
MAECVKKATREGYGDALVELGREHDDLIVMDADLAGATRTGTFKKVFPERFFNAGIAEANMVGVAAGLASCGKKVFASSFAMFATGRAYEQIRNSVAYPHLNVKIAASHGGISVGEDGATHQCIEDLALMRVIPNMVVLNPADYFETKKAVKAAYEWDGPVYLRFGRLAVPVIFDETYPFEIGKGVQLRGGDDVTIVATGLMVNEAMIAAELLQNEGISARVINMATIKPIDRDILVSAAAETGAIVTAEEHSIIGGLGSAVAEVLAENRPTPMIRVGVEDTFGVSGPAWDLLEKFGLCAANIVAKAKQVMAMK